MERRTFFVGFASASVTFPLAGCSQASEVEPDPNTDPDPDGEDIPTAVGESAGDETPEDDTREDDSVAGEEPDPISFEGDGPTVTDEFDLEGGFIGAEMEHTGDGGEFRVRLIDEESGYLVRSLSNESDEWSGEVGGTFDTGTYLLDIEADGEWVVELRQPRPTEGDEPPIEESCTTSTVLGPYELDGRLRATASHRGSGKFRIRTHDANANGKAPGNSIVNTIGEFEDTTTFSGQGLRWISVESDGDWEVEIE